MYGHDKGRVSCKHVTGEQDTSRAWLSGVARALKGFWVSCSPPRPALVHTYEPYSGLFLISIGGTLSLLREMFLPRGAKVHSFVPWEEFVTLRSWCFCCEREGISLQRNTYIV